MTKNERHVSQDLL
jgi:hypothetical protein